MAEVLGIVAGALGVLDVTGRGVERLNHICTRWTNCPDELLALRNELEDLRVVLDQIRTAELAIETASQQDAALARALSEKLRNANEHVVTLSDILDQLASLKKFKKKYNWIRREGKIEILKRRIRAVREDINSLLLTHGVIKATRVELDILSVATLGTRQHQDVATKLEALRTCQASTRNDIATVRNELQRFASQSVAAVANSQQLATSVANRGVDVADTLQKFISQLDDKFDRLATTVNNSDLPSTARQRTIPQLQGGRSQSFQFVKFTTARARICPKECTCPCHSLGASHWRLPQCLSYVMGSLFFRYTGWPASFASCDPSCNARRQTRVQFTYVFPIWFLKSSILGYINKVSGRSPEMLLILKNRVQWGRSPFFQACHFGDLKKVEELYRDSPWLTRDVRDHDGTNALIWAVRGGHVDIVKFLIAMDERSADNEDDEGRCPKQYFCLLSIAEAGGSETLDSEMSRLLGIRDYMDEIQLPAITRSILRFPGAGCLKDIIRNHQSRCILEASIRDEFGKNALYWACVMGDCEAAQLLVDLGTDVNAPGRFGSTLLHEAVSSPAGFAIIDILFQAGAEFRRNRFGNTPLHNAGERGTTETVQALIDHGAPLEDKGKRGRTPLLDAANGNLSALKCLIENGSNTGVRDEDGYTGLQTAIWNNAHECIEELLSRGVNHGGTTTDGETILHSAGRQGDLRTLSILFRYQLPGLDIYARNNSGMSAMELLQDRSDVTDELEEAFNALLDAVQGANTRLGVSEEDDQVDGDNDGESEGYGSSEDDEFHDAEEGI